MFEWRSSTSILRSGRLGVANPVESRRRTTNDVSVPHEHEEHEVHEEGLAGPTVRHMHRVLHMILDAAVDDGRLSRNPAARVKLPHDRRREKRFLTHDELAALAHAAGPDRLVVLVLGYCGLRFGELAALRVRNVDPMRRRLQIEESATEVDGVMVFGTPKSHQCRSVPIPAR